jgi:hypothetical protein
MHLVLNLLFSVDVTLHRSWSYFRGFELVCRFQLQGLKTRSSLNLDIESLNVSFSPEGLRIVHGSRFPYQILGISDCTAVRLQTDAYFIT